MATEDEREIYRQRSESERSWYRLEWQIFQWGVVIGLVTLGLGEKAFSPQWWQFLISGAVFIKFSYAMQRISKGFRDNREILRVYASRVGDYIPKVSSKPLESAAVRSRLILHTVGVLLALYGIYDARFSNCLLTTLKWFVFAVLVVEMFLWLFWQTFDTSKFAQPILPCIRVIICAIVILIFISIFIGIVFVVICSLVA